MSRKLKLALGIVLLPATLIAGTYHFAPTLAKWYINKNYPYVKFDELQIQSNNVILKNVSIEKDNISIVSPVAQINSKSIILLGGIATVDLKNQPKTILIQKENKSKNISAIFDNVYVITNNNKVYFKNVILSSLNSPIIFQSAQSSITHDSKSMEVKGSIGYINKQDKQAFVSYTNFVYDQKSIDLYENNIDWRLQELNSNKIVVNPYGEFNKVYIKLENDSINAVIGSAKVQYPTFFVGPLDIEQINAKLNLSNKIVDLNVGQVNILVNINEKRVVSKSSCQNWIDILPAQLKQDNPLEDNIKMNGNIDFDISIGDKPSFSLKYDCSLNSVCSSLPHITKLQKPFSYYVYDDQKNRVLRETGPQSKEWIPRNSISEHLVNAAIRMEDPGFPHHNGVLIDALKNSFIINIKSDKFVRGGSTITMQTAKNLWLSRDKTIGRKATELLLATILNKCLTKEQTIELYFNIIEYGKNIYGIANGAQYYFQKSPGELDPVESFYIASILPHPRTASKPDEATLFRIETLMYKLDFDSINNSSDAYLSE